MRKSVYFKENGIPQLLTSYCVFMDILGFTNTISDSFAKGEGEALFQRFYEVISSQTELLTPAHDPGWPSRWIAKLFTDNIVLGHPLKSPGESEFGSVVWTVASYQLAMALEGFFVRGGIALGDLFIDDNTVFGPALIEAHAIESTLARDPRIILSKDVHDLVITHTKFYARPASSPQNRVILIDVDGRAFVNYLDELILDHTGGHSVYWDGLGRHKKHIEAALLKYKHQPSIWSKYDWLANYHNFFCAELQDYSGYSESYFVTSELAKTYPFRLIKEDG